MKITTELLEQIRSYRAEMGERFRAASNAANEANRELSKARDAESLAFDRLHAAYMAWSRDEDCTDTRVEQYFQMKERELLP